MNILETYGWNSQRQDDWDTRYKDSALVPARVTADYGTMYTVALPESVQAQLSGASAHKLASTAMPKIGDWVAVEMTDETAIIQDVLPRTSEIIRGHVGRLLDKQVIATNVDKAFVVQPLDHDFSPARLQRYVFQLANQSIKVVILLNKSDQAKDAASRLEQLSDLGVDIVTMSALHDVNLDVLDPFVVPGETIVILGSSGAGKSTLTNRLLGEDRQATQEIRERDSKGRHTTVHRELFVLPGGGMIIDTPGIRELQLWGDEADLEATFPDIFDAIHHCHYRNCTHVSEDRCAVKERLANGTLDQKRYDVYRNFKRELQLLDARRGYIEERRTAQSKESAKRQQRRSMRAAKDHEPTLEIDD